MVAWPLMKPPLRTDSSRSHMQPLTKDLPIRWSASYAQETNVLLLLSLLQCHLDGVYRHSPRWPRLWIKTANTSNISERGCLWRRTFRNGETIASKWHWSNESNSKTFVS